MSNNIENRIVEMRFDNAQFEAAVAKTMDTLDKFKDKLNFKGSEKGLDKLGKASGDYKYTLDDIGSSLDKVNGQLASMNSIGSLVFSNLANKALDFATNSLGKMFSGITQGGLSRAMNLEQAKFQMQGIYKDAEKVHDIIYEAILPELMGTPYSLDQAAVVIGQLGASGIQSAEQVREATRAISGLAAMSGRGFDEVGRVFSKVAGQGAMMGGELQQLSGYGINAAANIAEYFNKVVEGEAQASDAVKATIAQVQESMGALDEAAIRDAASERLITYESMAAAFDTLYGPHAKKSTEMYTGALEDLKAALARIGAEPAAVGLEFLRNAFNALVPAVDAVNAVLKPFTSATKDVVDAITGDGSIEKKFGGDMYGSLAKSVQGLGVQFANLFVQMDKNGTITRWTEKSIKDYKKSLDQMEASGKKVLDWQRAYADYAGEGDAIMNPHMWRIVTAATQSFVNIVGALGKALKAIGQGFKDAMPKVTLDMIAKLVEGFRNITKSLNLSQDNLGRLRLLSAAVFTPLGLAVRLVGAAFKVFVTTLHAVFNTLKPLGNAIAALVGAFSNVVFNTGKLVTNLGHGASGIAKFVLSIVGAIAQFFKLDKLLGLIQNGVNKLATLFDSVGNSLGNFIGNLTSNISNIAKSAYEFLNLGKAIEIIRSGVSKFKSGISTALHLEDLKTSLGGVKKTVSDFLSQDNFFKKFIDNLKALIDWLKELIPLEEIIDTVSASFDKFIKKIQELTSGKAQKVQDWIERLKIWVGDLADAFKETKAGEWIAKQLIKPFGQLKGQKNWFVTFIDVLKGIGTIALNTLGFESFGDAIKTIGEKIKGAVVWFGKFLGLLGDVGKSKSASAMDKVGKSLKSAFTPETSKSIKGLGEALGGLAGKVGGGLSGIGKMLSSLFESFDVESAKKFMRGVGVFVVAIAYVKTIKDFMDTIKAFGNVANSIGDLWGLKSINTAVANTLKMIGLATALVMFAIAVRILGTMPWQQMVVGAAVILAALGAFWLILKVLEKMASNPVDSTQVTALALAIAAIGAGIVLLAAAVKMFSGMNSDELWQGVGAVGMLILIFTVMMKIFDGSTLTSEGAKTLAKAAFGMIAIAKAINMLVEPIAQLGALPWQEMMRGVGAIIAIIAFFSLFAFAVRANAKVFSAAVGMIAIAGAITIIAHSVKKMNEAWSEGDLKKGALTIAGIFVALAVFAAIAGHAKSSIFEAAIGMLALGVAIKLICDALIAISSVTQGLGQAWGILATILIGFTMFASVANGDLLKAGVGMLAIASAILILVASMQVLAGFTFDELVNGFGNLIGVILTLAGTLFLFQKIIEGFDLEDAANILAVGAAIFLLSTALALLASIPFLQVVGAIMLLVGAIALVGGVMLLFSSISVGILVTAAAFAVLGVACILVGGGMMLLVVALTALIPLILMLATTDLSTLNAGLTVLQTVASGLKDVLLTLALGAVAFGLGCLVAGVGIGVLAIALAALGVAAVIASLGIMALIGTFSLLSAGLQFFTGQGLLEGISSGVQAIAGGVKDKIKSLFFGTNETAKTEAKKTGESAIEGILQGTSEASASKSSSIQDALSSPFDSFLSDKMPNFIDQSGISSNDLMSAMASGISDGEGDISSSTSDVLGAIDTEIDAKQLEALWGGQQIGDAIGSGIGEVNLAPVSSDLADGAISGISGKTEQAKGAGSQVAGNAVMGLNSQLPGASTTGQMLGQTFVTGVNSKFSSARSAGSNLGSGAKSGAGSTSLYGVGTDAGSGYVNGVRSKWGDAYNAGYSLGQAAKLGTQAAQNSHSPAKEFIKFGKWAVEGYIIGLQAMPQNVKNAAAGIARSGMDAMMDAMQTVASIFDSDIELNPTITPVVDLTKVNESVSQIDNSFNSASIGLNNQLMGNLSAVNNSFRNNPNDLLNKNLSSLTQQLSSMTESMNSRMLNNYITIDGAGDPEAFADGLINSFKLNARTV